MRTELWEMVAGNLVFQVGSEVPELSIFVQYLTFGSIHPTANHCCFHGEEDFLSPLAEIMHTSILIPSMRKKKVRDEEDGEG